MKFSHKLAKLADPATALSFKRGVLRLLHPLPVSRFMKEIDPVELARIQRVYGVPGEEVHPPKYVQAERFLKMNIRRVQDMGLDRTSPKHILDIGSGAGYFLFVAKVLGHTGFGLDLEEPKLYEEMFALFGLKRAIHRVVKFEPLPDTGAKYDLITAHSIVFNDHDQLEPWGEKEWDYFLNDATLHLNPGGRIYLGLNPRPYATSATSEYYSDALRDFFLGKGAEIDRRDPAHLLFPPKP